MTHLEDEVRATMRDHAGEAPPLDLPALRGRESPPRTPIMLAAAVAVLVVTGGIFFAVRSAREDGSRPQPPAATSTSPSTSATTSPMSASSAQSGTSRDADEDVTRTLSQLAASVPAYPGAEPPDGHDSLSLGDDGNQRVLSRVRRAAAPITGVLAWYQGKFPHPHGWSPLTNGHAELDVTPAVGDDVLALFIEPHVQLLLDGTNTATTITIRASGYPVGSRTSDTQIPADQIVSATLSWRLDDAATPTTKSRTLSPDVARMLIDDLNAASVRPEMTASSLGKGVTTTLTFTANDGRTYRATYDSASPLMGTELEFGAPSSRRLDLPAKYYALLERLTTE